MYGKERQASGRRADYTDHRSETTFPSGSFGVHANPENTGHNASRSLIEGDP